MFASVKFKYSCTVFTYIIHTCIHTCTVMLSTTYMHKINDNYLHAPVINVVDIIDVLSVGFYLFFECSSTNYVSMYVSK